MLAYLVPEKAPSILIRPSSKYVCVFFFLFIGKICGLAHGLVFMKRGKKFFFKLSTIPIRTFSTAYICSEENILNQIFII